MTPTAPSGGPAVTLVAVALLAVAPLVGPAAAAVGSGGAAGPAADGDLTAVAPVVGPAAVGWGGAAGPADAGPGGAVLRLPARGPAAPDVRALAAANNTTVPRHRDPATVDESGDLAATSDWLARRLAARLGEGAIRIEQGEYEAARRVVGDRFDARLADLVEVAGETEAGGDDRLAEALSRTRDRHRRFADAVADYRETRRAYRDARRAGNETRARELARELERLADTVDSAGDGLVEDYAALSDETGADLDEAVESTRSVQQNVTDQQAAVRDETFVATRLVVAAPTRTVAFTDPLAIHGRLAAADGTPLSDRAVRLRVGTRLLDARTNATGGFRLRYRPVGVAANASEVAVRYRPRNASAYLGAAASVPVSVRPVSPAVAVAVRPSPVGFGDRLAVSGSVTAGGVGVPSVPVVVRVGATRLGRVRTGPNGSFALSTRLPPGVAAGDRRVVATVATSGRAVAAANGSAVATVDATPADLDVSARPDDGAVAVTGRLTADGRPVAGRPVTLRANGSHLRTVTTAEDGRYAASFPRQRLGDGAVAVTAVHDAAGSNVGDATARTTVVLSGGGNGRVVPERWPVGLAVGLVVLAAGAVAAAAGRGRRRGADDRDKTAERRAAADYPEPSDPLVPARDRLAAGDPAGAVRAAYGAVRRRLSDGADPGARTHWEFYDAVVATDGVEADALRQLTETFERARFAPEPPGPEAAADALAAAEELLE